MGILRPGRLNVYPRPLHETENQRRPQLFWNPDQGSYHCSSPLGLMHRRPGDGGAGSPIPSAPSTSPSLTQLNSDSTICQEVKICQGAGQASTFCTSSLLVLKHYISELGCPCVPLVSRERPDLSFYCNWVSLVGLPSSQLSKEIIQKCTAASTTVQVPAEAEAGGNFQMHSLITLSTPGAAGCTAFFQLQSLLL